MCNKRNLKFYVSLVVFLLCMLAIQTIAYASLVAQYHFDAGSGTTASDSSGYGNNGTISGAAWVQLPSGYCLSFDGINDYVNCGNNSSLNLTSAVTMVAWVCPWVSSGAEAGICGRAIDPVDSRYALTYYANNSYWFYINAGSINVKAMVTPGIWNQIAVTYDNSAGYMKIYVNGVIQAQKSYSSSIYSNSLNFYIGACSSTNSPFKGLIDEVSVYNTALDAASIAGLYSSSTQISYNNMFASNGIEDGLVAHYACNEGTGTTVNDSSGFLNTGTASNTSWYSNSSPNYGYSLNFNGTSSYVDCGSKNGLDINGPITVSTWVYPFSTQDGEVGILGKGFGSYQLTYYNGNVYWYINWSGGRYLNAAVSANAWSQITATYDRQNLKLYVNGSLVGTSTTYTSAINTSGTFYLGRVTNGTWHYFNGLLDEVKVYNKALSSSEISAGYKEDSESRNGLVAHYLLNKNTGNQIPDASGRGNTATLHDGTWDEGPAGTALFLDAGITGDIDYVDCGNSSSLDIRNAITMAAWIRPETYQYDTSDRAIFGKGWGSFLLTYCYDESYWWYIDSNSNADYAFTDPAEWSRVVATFDGTYMKIYINGSLVRQVTSTYSAINQGSNLYLGCAGLSGGVPQIPFRGHYSDVKIYNRALSATEVSNDYQSSAIPTVRLNSLVTELINKASVTSGTYYWYYTAPYDGWIYFKNESTLSGSSQVTVDDYFNNNNLNVITQTSSSDAVVENMRYMKAGTHLLTVTVTGTGTLNAFTVRTIPELTYCQYTGGTQIVNYGSYDWDWLSDNGILDNVNTLITDYVDLGRDTHYQGWHDQGKRLISDIYVCDPSAYSTWWNDGGYQNALGDGIIVDEFYRASDDSRYSGWSTDINNIYNNAGVAGKMFYAYLGGATPWTAEPGNSFIQTIYSHGGILTMEDYVEEAATASAADTAFNRLNNEFTACNVVNPGTNRHWVTCFGYMSAPNEFLDKYPGADFKAFLDRGVNRLATDSTFKDLYGMSMYVSRYADEENVRWQPRLYRHYGIEGNRSMLSYAYGYNYNPGILQNTDFESGSNYWTLYPAQPGSITTGTLSGWGWLQGRDYSGFLQGTGAGNTYIKTTRCSNGPNYIEQTMTGLIPGEYYSIKMFCADYQDMANAVSSQEDLHARLYVYSGGTVDAGKSFYESVHNNYSHCVNGFNDVNIAYMNFFRVVFQATSTTALIGISDWPNPGEPGGPIGQQIMYNYIQAQPYLYD